MRQLLDMFFKGDRLRDASNAMLGERCGIRLGPKGQALLDRECKHVAKLAGNRHDVGSRVLSTMVREADVYGLDEDAALSMARWAERLAKDAALPDTASEASAVLAQVRRKARNFESFR